MAGIKKFVFNPFRMNTYVVWDEQSKYAAVIDPGMETPKEKEQFSKFIKENELLPVILLNTHCHIDHILGNAFVKEKYDTEFSCGEKDVFLLDLMIGEASRFGITFNGSPQPDTFLSEDREILVGNITITPIFTPGHSPGEFCFYIKDASVCFTGDVLFNEGIGRTDLWQGNYSDLKKSIHSKLFSLPEEVTVYPGHGESSTIGWEKKNNPFL